MLLQGDTTAKIWCEDLRTSAIMWMAPSAARSHMIEEETLRESHSQKVAHSIWHLVMCKTFDICHTAKHMSDQLYV